MTGVERHGASGRAREALLGAQVGGFVWDSDEAVGYEVALEALNRAVGALNVALDRAEAGDTSVAVADVADVAAELGEIRRVRATLDPTDRVAVGQVTTRYYRLADRYAAAG